MAMQRLQKDLTTPLALAITDKGKQMLQDNILSIRERQFMLLMSKSDMLSCRAVAKMIDDIDIVSMIQKGLVDIVSEQGFDFDACNCPALHTRLDDLSRLKSSDNLNSTAKFLIEPDTQISANKKSIMSLLETLSSSGELRYDSRVLSKNFSPKQNCNTCSQDEMDYQDTLSIAAKLLTI